MPPIPTIADAWRITLNWHGAAGPQPVNVFHVRSGLATEADVAAAIDHALQAGYAPDNMWRALATQYACNNIDVMKLDGVSPSQNFSIAHIQGNGSTEFIPAACVVVSLRTAVRGPRGRGRMYIGPISEDMQSNGELGSFALTTMADGWAAFFNDLSSFSGVNLAVASYLHRDLNNVTSMRVDSFLGTQRRRQDRLRP